MNTQLEGTALPWRKPWRRVATSGVPIAVGLSLAGLVGYSAWPLLRPAREVQVTQAVFDRSVAQSTGETQLESRATPTVQAPGWLEAEPYLTACTALTDGVVAAMEVLEGDWIEQGQVVARLIDDDARLNLRSAQGALAGAEAMLATAEADFVAAKSHWEAPIELERAVEVSSAAVAEVQAELAQLPSLIDAARATLTRLEEEAKRVRRSTQQGATNDLELITAEQLYLGQLAEVAALEARKPMLEARIERARADQRAATRSLELRIADRQRLDAAEAAVALARGAVEQLTAERDEAQLALDRTVIRAPISGFVQRRFKVPGDKVVRMMDSEHSAHFVHLYDPSRLQVRVDVPLADAAHVSVGQACEVVVEVLPDRTFRGEVLRVTHEADLQKNTLQVKVKVIDPDSVLRPEMLTRVKFLGQSAGGGPQSGAQSNGSRVLVPAAAFDDGSGTPRVWTVSGRHHGRGVLVPTPVSVVSEADGWLTVTGSLAPGALLAVGVERPREGERVVVVPPRAKEGG